MKNVEKQQKMSKVLNFIHINKCSTLKNNKKRWKRFTFSSKMVTPTGIPFGPRQKNSPLDCFYLRFGWLLTSSKLGTFLFDSLIFIKNKNTLSKDRVFLFLVTPTGIEPMILPWEGSVLTAWPTGHNDRLFITYL